MDTPGGKYGGETAAQRKAQRRARLISAALDIVADGGAARLTVRGVCSTARLNDRYFYENFRDCDELLIRALEQEMSAGVEQLVTAVGAAAPELRAKVRAAVEAAFRFVSDDERRAKLLIAAQTSEALRPRRDELIRSLAQIMSSESLVLLDEHRLPHADAELAALALVSGGLEIATMWLRGDLPASEKHLVDFIVALILTTAEMSTALERELSE
ncbi:TetR/AcrR family transcriptional regulator [Hoyosella sp. YIM 151337]|uniref:TetR/AcrR family transcriptional regulator n=1 Tax=Hoyosella sp. YIM 151337 TaxID=2992742 RepID=UPI002235CBBD|nr:TetR/AcrR family transcriptional regulator [Hoyosella sp. YIM 151337]MCW4354160.1 TetR/AcrR family transcriptional regulator [Hoyosella sp. YIM 151337]